MLHGVMVGRGGPRRNGFVNVPGFTPSLPASVPGTFMIADLLEFAGVLVQ